MTMEQDDAIAIVGYGGIFPGAADLEQFWANIIGGVDSTARSLPAAGCWPLPRRLTRRDRGSTRSTPRAEGSFRSFPSTPSGWTLPRPS